MSTLFTNNNAEGGYRLRYMEIYNWGTFHGKIYKLIPDGRTSLLTGANGSGKTTLIDALLTLLVPSNKRFYNQSSGAEIKKERDEQSYFWGYHGKTYSDEDEISRTEQLRNKADNPYSVLLACFQNAGTLHTITLVQIRWFSGGSLKKAYIIAPYPLTVAEHFGKDRFDIRGEWRKKIKKQFPKLDLYDSFKDYSSRFSDLFGLKEKALSLFNQTVGIKVLGDLTQFVRQQMLEEPESEEQFKHLHSHYTDLLISHNAIKKDEKQLELLTPIVDNKISLEKQENDLGILLHLSTQFPLYADKLEFSILNKKLESLERNILIQNQKKEELSNTIQLEETERDQLISQKAALNIDYQIGLLNKDLSSEIEKRDRKQMHCTDYNKLAVRLGLQLVSTDVDFHDNLAILQEKKTKLEDQLEELTEKRFDYKSTQKQLQEKTEQLQEAINSYMNRKNRIPPDLIHVRAQLLELLETGEEELPFVGELLRVNDSESHWEDSIERVLNSFSRQLVVPERYIKQVNHFVHSNNLGTRLIYQLVDTKKGQAYMIWPTEEELLINKLEIKSSTSYKDWLKNQLFERYNYLCTDNLEVFYGSRKSITSNGLIRNLHRHEKDDRPNKWSKLNYTLGWDNKETIQLLIGEKELAQKEYRSINKQLEEHLLSIKKLEDVRPLLIQMSLVTSFDEINWEKHAIKIESILRQIDELKGSSDQYQAISKQLEQVAASLVEKKKAVETYIKEITKQESDYLRFSQRKIAIKFDTLSEEGEVLIQSFLAIEKIETNEVISLEALAKFKEETQVLLKRKTTASTESIRKLKESTIEKIAGFLHPPDNLLREFPDWSGDVINISTQLTSLDELEDIYNNIRHQRLVEHKRRFREYMDKSMLDALTSYRTWLNNEEEKIKDVIAELNIPLRKITFNKNPDTYLQLEYRPTKEQEIKLFKEQLSSAIPSALEFSIQTDDAYRENVFQQIKNLITELQKEETWRKKVTDIRNWLSFSAREHSVADNKPGQYHDNTASYSGGQKAQFTYAILGAAIAHQFGIFEEGKQHRSLRFITVDEAFSKLDPEKSQFLMEFCAQLNLQILVVTPLDKINIAEPYIHAVHFVEIKNKRHSVVYNLTMDEYRDRKEEFNHLATITE